jgi:hypothetical protein
LKNFNYECPEGRDEDDLTTANKENLARIKSLSNEIKSLGLQHFLNIPVRYDSIPRGQTELGDNLLEVLNEVAKALEVQHKTRKNHQKGSWNKNKDQIWELLSKNFSGKEVILNLPFGDFTYPSKMVDSPIYDWIMCLLSAFESIDQSFSVEENKVPNGVIDNVHQEEGVNFKGAMLMKLQRPIHRMTINNEAQALVKLVKSGLRCSEVNETQPSRYFNQVLGLGLFAPDTETMNKMIKKDAGCAARIEAYKRNFASTAEGGDMILGVSVRASLESVWFSNLHNSTRLELIQKGHAMLETVNQAMRSFMNPDRSPLEIDLKVRELAHLGEQSLDVQRNLNRLGIRCMSMKGSTHHHKTAPLSKQEVNILLKKLSDSNEK